MRIAIDCRFAASFSGLGRYTREVVLHLVPLAQNEQYVLIVRSAGESWIDPIRDRVEMIVADIPHYSVAEQTKLPGILRRAHIDLLFSPHFNVPFFCPVPFVATIHDLILHRFPNQASFVKQCAYRILMHRSIRRARSVIAISEFVKSEIRSAYGVSAEKKTTVISEGVDASYTPRSEAGCNQVKTAYGLQKPYFLYVGNAKEHKNVKLLIDAFTEANLQEAELVLVSGGPEFGRLLPLPQNVRQLTNVSDADLPALYSGAVATVTASVYEGYCLPVAEALACGCPVIAPDRSAIPEILEGRGVLIEPTVEAFTAAFQQPPARREPVVVGTWEATADRTREILLAAVSRKY